MSCTTAVMLQDRLNDIERNAYDGIDFRQELNEAYALADELEDENAKLIVKLNAEHIVRQNVEVENAKLRELAKKLVILAFARCADCDLLNASCALVSTQKCLLWNECESIARELGIEVSE